MARSWAVRASRRRIFSGSRGRLGRGCQRQINISRSRHNHVRSRVYQDSEPSKLAQTHRLDPTMSNPAITTDSNIRSVLHSQRLRRQNSCPDTLVIDELGLAHARSRVDVAVISGYIHGYEIKSSQDSLDRLVNQINIYRQALQKVTIVTAHKHLPKVLSGVPGWCGVIEAVPGVRSGIR